MARAPAEVRAQVAWLPKRLRDLFGGLITTPVLTAAEVERAGAEYLDAVWRVRKALGPLLTNDEALALAQTRLAAAIAPFRTLAPWPRAAATRALATVTVLFHLGRELAGAAEPRVLQELLDSADFTADTEGREAAKALVLFFALLEALKDAGPVPGRAAALARRADEVFHVMAERLAQRDPPLRLPWYFRDAPGAEQFEAFGIWRTDLLERPASSCSPEDAEAWERVKQAIDAARPDRPVFG